ncbi:hypothetical protein Sfulv_10380 [Streptomyces fulvorobeus]|uniref:Uncharacterized protein n=1 Tax=Streptomyces fulvorobeus TaxID=284028 RepID=A0A7J0C2G7_9ACTN|nr:hypothetical protein Sfulv_10380 [Streptomyces fulvorobeus]
MRGADRAAEPLVRTAAPAGTPAPARERLRPGGWAEPQPGHLERVAVRAAAERGRAERTSGRFSGTPPVRSTRPPRPRRGAPTPPRRSTPGPSALAARLPRPVGTPGPVRARTLMPAVRGPLSLSGE